ncbi:DUF1801 domain-containing protein [bacterium]|nr:DUF1801 domain-containing protein [Candidatus Elulimicrobium humile]
MTPVEEYIQNQVPSIQPKLELLRQAIREVAPEVEEVISYNMPTFKLNKVLVYYAVNKNHIGFYPTPSPILHFQKELKPYKTSKGAIQFPLDQPLPIDLIQKIVKFRIKEDKNV